ncbi:MAG: FxLYD domain-containing protein, partial [bacterium]
AQNPYNRDALFNLAVTYLTLEQNDKVGPMVTRLIAVDPANPENYNLAARAYLALSNQAKAAKKTALAAAYNDTTINWYSLGNKLPIEVTLREFSPSEKQVVIGGNVTDRRDKMDANTPPPAAPAAKGVKAAKAKPAAAPAKVFPPKTYTLTFVALDKTGAAVGTETAKSEPLTPGQSFKFKITINSPNVVAYKYTISES